MSEYAENLPYWKTGNSSPDTILDKAAKEICKANGTILSEGFGSSDGRSAYMLRFKIEERTYRVVWPTAESKFVLDQHNKGFAKAARRQAASMLFHDVKAMCIKARSLGSEVAFFSHLELPDGKIASELVGAIGDLPNLLEGGH